MRRKIYIRKYKPKDLEALLSISASSEHVLTEWSRLGRYRSRLTMLKRRLKYNKKDIRKKLNA